MSSTGPHAVLRCHPVALSTVTRSRRLCVTTRPVRPVARSVRRLVAVPDELDIISCEDAAAWDAWLAANHRRHQGVWLKIAKQHTGAASVTNDEAVDVGLCWGWISGHRKALDQTHFLQRYTPRRPRSNGSAVNVAKVEALIAAGRMRPPGLAEVDAAKADGRWDRASGSRVSGAAPRVSGTAPDGAGRPSSVASEGSRGRAVLRAAGRGGPGEGRSTVARPFQSGVPAHVRRGSAPVPADPPSRARRRAAAEHGSHCDRDLLRCRARQRRLVHHELPPDARHPPTRVPRDLPAGATAHPDPELHRPSVRSSPEPHVSRRRSFRSARSVTVTYTKESGMIRIANAQFWVHDQDEALAFYTRTLGWEVRADVTIDEWNFRWLVVGPVGQHNVGLVLMPIPRSPLLDDDSSRQLAELVAKGAGGTLFLETDDCQASFGARSGKTVRPTGVLEFSRARH